MFGGLRAKRSHLRHPFQGSKIGKRLPQPLSRDCLGLKVLFFGVDPKFGILQPDLDVGLDLELVVVQELRKRKLGKAGEVEVHQLFWAVVVPIRRQQSFQALPAAQHGSNTTGRQVVDVRHTERMIE